MAQDRSGKWVGDWRTYSTFRRVSAVFLLLVVCAIAYLIWPDGLTSAPLSHVKVENTVSAIVAIDIVLVGIVIVLTIWH